MRAQRPGDAPVQVGGPVGRHVVLEGTAHHRVGERQTVAVVDLAHHPGPHGVVEPVAQVDHPPPDGGRQHVERELLAHERGRRQRLVDLGGQAGQPPPHDVVHPLGQAVRRASVSARAGSAGSRPRRISCTNSGLPAVSSVSQRAPRPRPRWPAGGPAPRPPAGVRRRGRGPARRCGRPGSPPTSRPGAAGPVPSTSPSRRVTTISNGPSGGESSTWRSSSSDERSAHWRSSSTSRTGRRAAMAPSQSAPARTAAGARRRGRRPAAGGHAADAGADVGQQPGQLVRVARPRRPAAPAGGRRRRRCRAPRAGPGTGRGPPRPSGRRGPAAAGVDPQRQLGRQRRLADPGVARHHHDAVPARQGLGPRRLQPGQRARPGPRPGGPRPVGPAQVGGGGGRPPAGRPPTSAARRPARPLARRGRAPRSTRSAPGGRAGRPSPRRTRPAAPRRRRRPVGVEAPGRGPAGGRHLDLAGGQRHAGPPGGARARPATRTAARAASAATWNAATSGPGAVLAGHHRAPGLLHQGAPLAASPGVLSMRRTVWTSGTAPRVVT